MIRFYEQVPSVYTSASRDFQYMSWLIDIVLNSVKHNVDDLYDLPNAGNNTKLTELLAMTLGFKVKRNYDQKQLAALVAVLPRILKYKGTETAIRVAGNALIAASGAVGSFNITKVAGGELEVVLPENLVDVSLFTDLLGYILPAGMTYRIRKTNQVPGNISTKIHYHDTALAEWQPDLDWDVDNQVSTGLANMFTPTASEPVFSNYRNSDVNDLNVGLLDNSVIPTLATALGDPPQNSVNTTNDIATDVE